MKLSFNKAMCSGCRACEMVCAYYHHRVNNPKKAVLRIRQGDSPGRYQVRLCTQCGLCQDACPGDAIILKDGVYLVVNEDCTSCYSCVEACPEGVMFVPKDGEPPVKCDLCGECVRQCPPRALFLEED